MERMADTAGDAPSAVVDTLSSTKIIVVYLAKAIRSVSWGRHASRLLRLVALPLSVVTVPLSLAAEVLLVVFAPLIYLVGLVAYLVHVFFSLLVSLKPLYSFLSAAAGIGVFAGLILGITSSVLTSYLGMHDIDTDDEDDDYGDDNGKYDDKGDDIDDEEHSERMFRNRLENSREMYKLDIAYKKYLLGAGARDSLVETGATKRRMPRGLLSQTIHEEDDSSVE